MFAAVIVGIIIFYKSRVSNSGASVEVSNQNQNINVVLAQSRNLGDSSKVRPFGDNIVLGICRKPQPYLASE